MTKSFVCNTALKPLVKPQDFKFKLYVRATYSVTTHLSLRCRRVALFVFANVRLLLSSSSVNFVCSRVRGVSACASTIKKHCHQNLASRGRYRGMISPMGGSQSLY